MDKITITLETETLEEAQKALSYRAAYLALWEISQEIFRPARKHGYNDPRMNEFLDSTKHFKDDDTGEIYPSGYDVISKLEDKFYEILTNNNIELD